MSKKRRFLSRSLWVSALLSVLLGSEWVRAASKNDEYSFEWLDPDKKIYVLQNRKFTKTGHLQLTAMGGLGISNPYRDQYNLDPRLTYYLSEDWGIEAFYNLGFFVANSTFVALTSALGGQPFMPSVMEVKGAAGGLVHWAPWYAKINVFNQILYFDWYFSGGAGQVFTEIDTRTSSTAVPNIVNKNFLAFYLGTGHQYHLSQSFVVRLDFMGAIFNAPILKTSGSTTWYTRFNLNAGIGWRL